MNPSVENISLRFKKLQRTAIGRKLGRLYRIALLLAGLFKEKRIVSLAQSLAYTSILSIVPIVAIFFFVLGQITENAARKQAIMVFVRKYFIPEYVTSIFIKLEELSKASLAFGFIGFPTLFLAGVLLYTKVNSSINEIWTSERESKWFKNGLAFFMTLFFGPMLLVLVFSIPPYLQTLPYYQTYAQEMLNLRYINALFTQAVPILVSTIGLFVLYLHIPATSVHPPSAVRGAFIAALLIQSGNFAVGQFLKSFSNFDVVYGSLAIVPILLLWVFVVWLVVLVGAALAFLHQFHHATDYKNVSGTYNNESLFSSAIDVLVYLSLCFEKSNAAPNFDRLQFELKINRSRLGFLLATLKREGLVVSYESAGNRIDNVLYQPGILPSKIAVEQLYRLFRSDRERAVFPSALNALLRKLDVHPKCTGNNVTIQDFVDSHESILSEIEGRDPPASDSGSRDTSAGSFPIERTNERA